MEISHREEAREVRYAREIMSWAKEHDPECANYVIEPVSSGWMFYGGPSYWWNRAMGFVGPVADGDLDRVVEFYTERGAAAQVLFASYAHDSLYKGLCARGFVVRDLRHLFARSLSAGGDRGAGPSHGLPDGLRVAAVDRDDPDAVRDYAEMASSGFRPADTAMSPEMLRFNRDALKHPECSAFLVRDGDRIVASCAVTMDSDVATLMGASVAPEYRNRGIQTALMSMRMEHARAHGCQVAMVQTTPNIATERNALRLGFYLVCARICMEKPL